MIVDERLVTYINSLDTGNTEILDEIEREALETYVPIVRKEMQSFLKLILSIKRPARILEVGTAVGFSAILMAEYNPIPCEITTIENYEKRIPIAKQNFVRAGKEKQITLLEGDAADILKELREPFDFIFMDIMMPKLNGWETTKKIRVMKRPDASEIPIIAMSANSFAEDIVNSRICGMNWHLTKPLDEGKLLEAFREGIANRNRAII